MRRSLEFLALLLIGWLLWLTYSALNGPERLPARIPIHFDAAGNANGWGSPSVLLLLPTIAVGLYLLLTVISLFPNSFHYSFPVTEGNRERLQALTLGQLAWIKVELLCLFGCLQKEMVQAAKAGQAHISPWLVPTFLAVVFGTVGWYLVLMAQASRKVTGTGGDSAPPPGIV
jgi:Domain of unknown function (DUF1648)